MESKVSISPSNAVNFGVRPAVTNLNPIGGDIGDPIVITGTGFDPIFGNNTVSFNSNLSTQMNIVITRAIDTKKDLMTPQTRDPSFGIVFICLTGN